MTNSVTSSSYQKYVRLAAIPLLLAVLLAVVFWPAADAAPKNEDFQPIAKPARASSSGQVTGSVLSASKRSPVSLDDVLAYDIFNPLPGESKTSSEGTPGSPEAADGSPAAVQELSRGQVKAIMKSGTGRIAIVDSAIVKVGDLIAGGRIVEITDSSVLIAPE